MGKDIIFTTETDGLVKHTIVNDKFIHLFPNMIDISLRIVGANENLDILIDNDIDIKPEMTRIHGITNEDIVDKGIRPKQAIEVIDKVIQDGDVLITHNAKFHSKVLEAFYFRLGKKMPEISFLCLQGLGTEICKLGEKINGKHKYPKLDEILDHFKVRGDDNKLNKILQCFDLIKESVNEQAKSKRVSSQVQEG